MDQSFFQPGKGKAEQLVVFETEVSKVNLKSEIMALIKERFNNLLSGDVIDAFVDIARDLSQQEKEFNKNLKNFSIGGTEHDKEKRT